MNEEGKDHPMNIINWIYRKFVCPRYGHFRNNVWIRKYRPRYCAKCGKYIGK
jgi:hypothetical protein